MTVDSGSLDVEEGGKSKQTEYGKVAKAIASIKSEGIKLALPDVNESGFSFIPDLNNSAILFSLKGINGIGDDVVKEVISKRPYLSLRDFLNKNLYKGSVIKKSHIIQLIKGGCFDKIEKREREEILRDFLKEMSAPKKSLNLQNMKSLLNYRLLPKELETEIFIYLHRKKMSAATPYKKIKNTNPKLKKKYDDYYYKISGRMVEFFSQHFTEKSIVNYTDKGDYIISKLEYDKEYETLIEPLKDYIKDNKELLNRYNECLFLEEWNKYAEGTRSKWEMDSLSFYHGDHELKNVNLEKYNITKFSSLSKEPEITGYNSYKGRKFPKYNVYRIMGTVLDKNDIKNSISLLTVEGDVVNVKLYGGSFAHYNKQLTARKEDGTNMVIEKSWFTRGNKLMVVGYRKDDQFILKRYIDTIYQHTVSLIEEVEQNGDLKLKLNRELEE